jgi:Ran GTPase-activating protein (RanGAP) involved in mRNA processing and transport
VKTLKFSNNGISPTQLDSLVDHLHQVPNIQTLFFDWNPLYKDGFRKLGKDEDVFYHRGEDEPSRYARFTSPESKLKILFMRGNELTDDDVKQICHNLKENRLLKVLDISYNNITKESLEHLKELTESNKTLEFIGLAKNNLSMEDLKPLLDCIGKQPFPEEEADAHIKKMKQRDAILEKMKTGKNQK